MKLVRNAARPLVYKMGRFGKFLACSGFPDCRNTKPIVKEIGVDCPRCGEGKIIERRSKKGRIFYGCDRYPECEFVSWDKPPAKPCPECDSMLVEKQAAAGRNCSCPTCGHSKECLTMNQQRKNRSSSARSNDLGSWGDECL